MEPNDQFPKMDSKRFCGGWTDEDLAKHVLHQLERIEATEKRLACEKQRYDWIREEQERRKPKKFQILWLDTEGRISDCTEEEASDFAEALTKATNKRGSWHKQETTACKVIRL